MVASVDIRTMPEKAALIMQIEAADRLAEMCELMKRGRPVGNFRPFKLTITTEGQMYFIGYSQAFINDGPGDVYFMERNMAPKADDAPLKSMDPAFELKLKHRPEDNGGLGILRWLRTDTGTATLRIFPLE